MNNSIESSNPKQKIWYVETPARIIWSGRKIDVTYHQCLSKYQGRMSFNETTLEDFEAISKLTDKKVFHA